MSLAVGLDGRELFIIIHMVVGLADVETVENKEVGLGSRLPYNLISLPSQNDSEIRSLMEDIR